MPTFVYMTRCDGCGHCVDICPSDIMHIDKTYRRAYNIEPNMCWECYSCVKACPQNAIDVRGYADFAPLGHSVRVHARRRERHDRLEDQIPERHGKELPVADHHQALGDRRSPSSRTFPRPARKCATASCCTTSRSGSAWMRASLRTLESAGLKLKKGVYY